jgi:hypothetical protein
MQRYHDGRADSEVGNIILYDPRRRSGGAFQAIAPDRKLTNQRRDTATQTAKTWPPSCLVDRNQAPVTGLRLSGRRQRPKSGQERGRVRI